MDDTDTVNETSSHPGDAVIVTDRNDRVTALNRAAELLTGWSAASAAGTSIDTLLGTPAGGRRLPDGLCIVRTHEGATRSAHAVSTPIHDREGEPLGAVTVLTTIASTTVSAREAPPAFDLAAPEVALAIDALGAGIREKAEEVAALMDVLPVAIYIAHDPDCVTVTSNRAADALLALPQHGGPSTGPYPHRVFSRGRELNPREMPIQRAAAEGIATTGEEYEIRFEDGSSRYIYGYATPLFGPDGRTRGAVAAFVDVTERRTQENALRESEERFRILADNLPVMIWVADRDGRCSYANRRLRNFTGSQAVNGWFESVHADDRERAQGDFMEHLQEHAPLCSEMRLKHVDGDYRWIMNNATPLYGPDGEFSGYIGTCTDITATKQHEEELQLADRQKDEFIATLAHELRNPLAPIRNALHILGSGTMDTHSMQWARDVIDRQVTQLVRLVDDLLDVARAACGQLELRTETCTIDSIIHAAVEASRPMLEDSHHELNISLPAEAVAVSGDQTRLAEILINLLNNAAKYTPRNGRVWVICESTDEHVIVRVRDTGVGIAADALPGIFRMFSQVNSSLDRAQGGLGVGLALARRLAELHGGTLDAYSAGPGHGSEFVLTLPRVAATVATAPRRDSAAPERPAEGQRVLVVDDSEDAAESLAMLLRLDGHTVITAHDGIDALEQYANNRPEAVILDIGLPGMNGYEVAERIRLRPEGRDVTLIALTGWGRSEERTRAFEAGFDHHVTKPVSVEALQKILALQTPQHQ